MTGSTTAGVLLLDLRIYGIGMLFRTRSLDDNDPCMHFASVRKLEEYLNWTSPNTSFESFYKFAIILQQIRLDLRQWHLSDTQVSHCGVLVRVVFPEGCGAEDGIARGKADELRIACPEGEYCYDTAPPTTVVLRPLLIMPILLVFATA